MLSYGAKQGRNHIGITLEYSPRGFPSVLTVPRGSPGEKFPGEKCCVEGALESVYTSDF